MSVPRTPPRHPGMPPIPQDGDGPVFREPWEAQAFAMALDLYDKGHFTWNEWVRELSADLRASSIQVDGADAARATVGGTLELLTRDGRQRQPISFQAALRRGPAGWLISEIH